MVYFRLSYRHTEGVVRVHVGNKVLSVLYCNTIHRKINDWILK